jgi:hypothetical protein
MKEFSRRNIDYWSIINFALSKNNKNMNQEFDIIIVGGAAGFYRKYCWENPKLKVAILVRTVAPKYYKKVPFLVVDNVTHACFWT